jgi:hypothetical protein
MDELKGRRARRLRRGPEAPAHPAPETAESVLPDLPRVGALDALLREVDSLRLTLETDLTLAASAVEAGAIDVAGDILDSDREGLRRFEQRALGHVAELAAAPPARQRRFRVPAAPFVAAAAVAGFLLGVVPHTGGGPTSDVQATTTAADTFVQLSDAARRKDPSDLATAAAQLHDQLEIAISQARTDPKAATKALDLLALERQVIETSGSGSTGLLQHVLAASLDLTKAIRSAMPAVAPPAVRATPAVPAVTISPRPYTSPAQPRPRTTSAPQSRSTTAKPASSPPSPSSTPSPATSSGTGTGLPGGNAFRG